MKPSYGQAGVELGILARSTWHVAGMRLVINPKAGGSGLPQQWRWTRLLEEHLLGMNSRRSWWTLGRMSSKGLV